MTNDALSNPSLVLGASGWQIFTNSSRLNLRASRTASPRFQKSNSAAPNT